MKRLYAVYISTHVFVEAESEQEARNLAPSVISANDCESQCISAEDDQGNVEDLLELKA